jgi:hypothetical protein
MENAVSSGIVSFKRSSRLWMAHFYESSAYGNCLLGIEKGAAGFSFRVRGSNCAYSFAKNMDGTVEFGIWRQTFWRIINNLTIYTPQEGFLLYYPSVSLIGHKKDNFWLLY